MNISAGQSQKTYYFYQLKAYGLYLHPWKFGWLLLPALGAAALQKWPLLGSAQVNCQLLETFWRMISRFWTKWTYNKKESLFKPRKHLNISATLYLVNSGLCNNKHLSSWMGEHPCMQMDFRPFSRNNTYGSIPKKLSEIHLYVFLLSNRGEKILKSIQSRDNSVPYV